MPAAHSAKLSDIRTVLVLLLCPIGDTLFATPVLRALHQAMPQAQITAVAYPTNRNLLEGRPDVDCIVLHPTSDPATWRTIPAAVKALRTTAFDLAISLNPIMTPVYRLLARARRWIELPLPPWWWLRSARRTPWATTHAVTTYLQTLQPLGITGAATTPDVPVTAAHRQRVTTLLDAHGIRGPTPLLSLHPGGEGYGGMKRWPADRFAVVGNALAERHHATVVIVGGKADLHLAGAVAARLHAPPVNLCGQTSLVETAAVLERCLLLVGNDSSPLHLAAAVGTPVVGIYGPSNPEQFAPVTERGEIVRSGRHCSPCFHFTGTQAFWEHPVCLRARCLEEVAPETVVAAAEQVVWRRGGRERDAA